MIGVLGPPKPAEIIGPQRQALLAAVKQANFVASIRTRIEFLQQFLGGLEVAEQVIRASEAIGRVRQTSVAPGQGDLRVDAARVGLEQRSLNVEGAAVPV